MATPAAKNLDSNEQLIKLQPGKYLLADKNEFIKLEETKTALLVEQIGASYRLVLVDNKLVIT